MHITATLTEKVKLSCTVINNIDPSDYTNIGNTCELQQREPITDDMENDTFEYIVPSSTKKFDIKTVWFWNHKISFVPKETLQEFPQIEGFAILYSDLTVVDSEWIDKVLKHVKPRIVKLYFYSNRIDQIDPKLIQYFAVLQNLKLWGNACVNENFMPSETRGNYRDASYMNSKLMPCYQNYITHQLKNHKNETFQNLLIALNNSLAFQLKNFISDAIKKINSPDNAKNDCLQQKHFENVSSQLLCALIILSVTVLLLALGLITIIIRVRKIEQKQTVIQSNEMQQRDSGRVYEDMYEAQSDNKWGGKINFR